ncbi:MAG: hypothetical protein HYZ49_18245 [Chloroflexi bacterium]|nr:hypothetical protein [Chloroflexota bacterium]
MSKPHAATSAGSDTFCYDQNGNMVKRVEGGTTYAQNFNAENMMMSVVTGGQTTTFVYDGDNTLVKKVKPDGTYTVYIGVYEVEYSAANAVTKKTSYYPGGAMRVDVVGGANTLYYLLKDHLGSASTLLDVNGNLVTNGEQRYYLFGESRITTADLKTARLFTGQLEVGLGGIYSYGARMYSPRLGRFLSADTVVPDWKNPQSLNRFGYTLNNPLKYIDPTGHASVCGSAYSDPECGGGGGGRHNDSHAKSNSTSNTQSYTLPQINIPFVGGPDFLVAPASAPEFSYQAAATSTPGPTATSQGSGTSATRAAQATTTVTRTPTPTASEPPDAPQVLYHYTSAAGLAGILASEAILPSLGTGPNAFFGEGIYFTDISPLQAAATPSYKLSRALTTTPWNNDKMTAFVAVDVSGLTVKWESPVFSNTYGTASIYRYPTTVPLGITDRVVSSGPVPYVGQKP